MRDEYQLCKVTSKANIPVKSWSSGINFGNVCDLDIEVRTNPHAMDNNHVRNSSNLNHWISNSKYNPNWDLNPGLFCFKKCCTIQLFGCFVFDSKNWQKTLILDLGLRSKLWHTLWSWSTIVWSIISIQASRIWIDVQTGRFPVYTQISSITGAVPSPTKSWKFAYSNWECKFHHKII